MPKFVIDSFAWIEYFIGSKKGELVKEILDNEKNEIFTSILTVAEVASFTKRENKNAKEKCNDIVNISTIYGVDVDFAAEAGILHAEIRKRIKDFGLADIFVLLSARKLGAKIVTGDPHFRNFNEAIMI